MLTAPQSQLYKSWQSFAEALQSGYLHLTQLRFNGSQAAGVAEKGVQMTEVAGFFLLELVVLGGMLAVHRTIWR